MSHIAKTIGRTLGTTAAYVWEGSRLASSELAAGAREGYAETAAQLRERRLEQAAARPAIAVQRKLRASAKA